MRNEELRKGANERDPNAPRLAEESTVEKKMMRSLKMVFISIRYGHILIKVQN